MDDNGRSGHPPPPLAESAASTDIHNQGQHAHHGGINNMSNWKYIRFQLAENHPMPYPFQIVWIGSASPELLAQSIRDAAGLSQTERFVLVSEEVFPPSVVVLNEDLANLGIIFTLRMVIHHQASQMALISMKSPKITPSSGSAFRSTPQMYIQPQMDNSAVAEDLVKMRPISSENVFDSGYDIPSTPAMSAQSAPISYNNESNGNYADDLASQQNRKKAVLRVFDPAGDGNGVNSGGIQNLSDAAAVAQSLVRMPSSDKKRRRTTMACEPCHKAKVGCDDTRPCRRCVRVGRADLCIDRSQRRIGRPRKPMYEVDSLGGQSMLKAEDDDSGAVMQTQVGPPIFSSGSSTSGIHSSSTPTGSGQSPVQQSQHVIPIAPRPEDQQSQTVQSFGSQFPSQAISIAPRSLTDAGQAQFLHQHLQHHHQQQHEQAYEG